jgi:hypothetical protein
VCLSVHFLKKCVFTEHTLKHSGWFTDNGKHFVLNVTHTDIDDGGNLLLPNSVSRTKTDVFSDKFWPQTHYAFSKQSVVLHRHRAVLFVTHLTARGSA